MVRKSTLLRVISFLLVFVLISPVNVFAESASQVQPRESYYLIEYQAYCYPIGAGRLNVYFEVIATGVMDEIGVLSIEIYESIDNSNWYWVRTIQHDTYPGMLVENDDVYGHYVTYSGIPGRYYKAYVCVWAGKNGGGDTRYFWTSSKKA